LTKPFQNPTGDEIRTLLQEVETIAVAGLSLKSNRPSNMVTRAMQGFGFRIVPVRPAVDQVLGEKAYEELSDIPFPVDLVNVLRAAEFIPGIVEECIALKVPALCVQEGIVHDEACFKARDQGIFTVMDRCIWKEYLAHNL
jgi:predicted CoA-binding protein